MFKKITQYLNKNFTLKILIVSVLSYVLWFYFRCCLKYDGYMYDDFDLAIYDQNIWGILHGKIFGSILGVDFLGNHVHFIFFLIAPFYYFFSTPLFLLFLQTVFLAAGAFPLYALAKIYLSERMSLVVAIIYLLYPGLGYTNLYEFHPSCFTPFLLLCTAYYFYKENFSLFNVFMFLSLLCQENISLIFVMWGIYSFVLKKEMKWVWWPTFIGLVYFLLCVYVILPTFNKNTFNFFHIYGKLGDSFGRVMLTCLQHPIQAAVVMLTPKKILFLGQLFVGLFFIPIFSPLALLPSALIFLQHLLSVRNGEANLHYHYTAELIPFLFIAFIFGIRKILTVYPREKFVSSFLLLNMLIVNLILGPHFNFMDDWRALPSSHSILQKESLINEVPPDASVVTTFRYLSHMTHREELYSFHHVYSGYYTLFTKPYHLPDSVQYALIDFNDPLTFIEFYKFRNYIRIINFLHEGSWGSMDVKDTTVLFKKGIKYKYPLIKFSDNPLIPSHSLNLIVDNSIELYGYDVSVQLDQIHVIFYWKLLKEEKKDINIFIDFTASKDHLIRKQFRPLCYRIWPTQNWQEGKFIQEHQYISVDPNMDEGLKSFKIGFYDFQNGKILPTNSKDALGRVEIKLTN